MDSEILAKMFDYIRKENYDIHSVTIIRNGYLVADAANYPFAQDLKHQLNSSSKSIISALIGIAIEQGYIENVQQPVLSFFPGRTVANLDEDKKAMTLEHLLIMSAGFEYRDSITDRWRNLEQLLEAKDWVQFMLDLPMAAPPGTIFNYSNGVSFLLSAIIQETTGMSAFEFAKVHLFSPLGIYDVEWLANPSGITTGYSGLRMRPRDMAKIGYLFLNDGRWDGAQIIPASWVAVSTREHISEPFWSGNGYGYQWWTTYDGVYSAQGYGGQIIFVIPEHELVVAFTGNLSVSDSNMPQMFLNSVIIPAAESSNPL